jgi:hypothetical protein
MRSSKYTFFILAFLITALSACHKDLPANPNATSSSSTGGSTGTMALQFNGATYTASSITAVDSSAKLQIAGVVNNSTNIYVATKVGFTVGSYDIATNAAAATFTASGTTYTATSGTIIVTAVTSTSVTGTFSFITTNAAGDTTGTATNGSFQTTYISR